MLGNADGGLNDALSFATAQTAARALGTMRTRGRSIASPARRRSGPANHDKTKNRVNRGDTAMTRRAARIGAGIVLLWLHGSAQPAQPLDAPAFSLRAPAQRAASGAAPLTPPDALQIEQLLAGQRLKTSPALTHPGADAAVEISNCTQENIGAVDPGNPNWNDKDPRWEPMRQTIALDCARRREERIKTVEPELQRMYRDALANSYAHRLSRRDAAALIGFYATETGRRFLAFQTGLTTIEFNAMQRLERAGGARAPASPATPAPDVMKRRTAVLLMSRQILLMLQWQSDAAHTGGDASGGAVAPTMMSTTATLEGDAIDRIQKEFARELPAFSAFLSSKAEKNEIRALADAQLSFGKASATQLIKLAPEWNGDLQKWREQYRKLPASGVPPASAPTPAK